MQNKKTLSLFLAISLTLIASGVLASTTIGNNITTGGDLTINSTKFVVTAASGNTSVAGTLGVTGATTLTGALTANGSVTLGDAVADVITVTGTIAGTTPLTFAGGAAAGNIIFSLPNPASDVTITFPSASSTLVTLAGSETLTNKTLTSPVIGTSVVDTNGAALLGLTATGSAVNYFALANAATGSSPTISATGTDTNIGLNLTLKGTGVLTVATDTTNADRISLLPKAGGGATFTGTLTSADLTGNHTWTLPNVDGNIITTGDSGTVTSTMLAGSIDLTSKVTGVLPVANGGTGLAYFTVAGPSATRTYTFPDADSTVVTLAASQTLAAKTLTTPTIADFTNAGHNHANAAGGGQLTDAVLSSAVTVAKGGTGLTAGTSGGLLYFSSTSALASSALLAANQIILGGGAGTTPATLGSLGTSVQVLHGNAAGAPTWSAVSLTADVTGVLPVANGGTGASSLTDLIALGTQTTGNYVASLTAGNGLSVGAAAEGGTPSVALGLLTADWAQTAAYDLKLGNGTFNNTSAGADLYVTGNIEADGTFYGNLTGNVTGSVTGNADTATALAANPTDCGANQFATTIAASGNLTCAALTDADVPNDLTVSGATINNSIIGGTTAVAGTFTTLTAKGATNYALAATADNLAYTLAVPITALTDGAFIIFKMPNANSGGAATLNVNSLGAKKMLKGSDNATQINSNDLIANGSYLATYNTSLDGAAGAWVILNK